MIIVTHGVKPLHDQHRPDWLYERTFWCERCDCMFQIERTDETRVKSEQRGIRDEYIVEIGYEIPCPTCHATVFIGKKDNE